MYVVGLVVALGFYASGAFGRYDWRPVLMGLGFAWSTIMVSVSLTALIAGRRPFAALNAYSDDQNMPRSVLYLLTAIGVGLLLGTMRSILLSR